MVSQTPTEYGLRPNTLTIPELEQSKAAVLNTLASVHSRRSYTFAIDRFIAWYCSEPRLTFNRAVVVRYRSHLEALSLSASTTNSHLSAIRKLADGVRGKRLADARTGDWNPEGLRGKAAGAENRRLALPEPGARTCECRVEDKPAGLAGRSDRWVTSRLWVTAF
jgi:hypothetical protein